MTAPNNQALQAFDQAQALYDSGRLNEAQDAFLKAARLAEPDDDELHRHLTDEERQAIKWRKLCFQKIEEIEGKK